ncbi:mannose-1-phosphate guanylyltransferase/mannose-6-phosphate isomerase [Pseudomonas sp. GOM7]|uniref:mannose-1-phosphate guanylyltransferase/mannose-6-phosphate isomerase n=1 Tax=Pseudomonas sp. GOM7 TaxID=2998079 RepID=UPI00227C220A|nr:mannose-1-phosphate guanylyltransferase/mannose-6-phosphate isomerase [Pseudomonas sp. GOM7]WAJ38966.1 mannose-1-phosphate guanylyltransferase/mannose-6-phosphate isomerase [Pseudomonas sp. GOM7]
MIPLILSGGSGSRLWPLSRKLYPKQFLPLTGSATMLQQTLQRLAPEGMHKPIVVCNEEHRFIVNEQLAAIGCEAHSILLEPFGRNTAPAVAIAAMHLLASGRDELLLVLPADHVIEDRAVFHQALEVARKAAEQGEMVLFGVPAERAETGYGYIKTSPMGDELPDGVLPVERFVEKPDLATAQSFVAQGDYFWNSGMFLFRCSRYLEELQRHDPDIYDTCQLALSRSKSDLQFIRIDPSSFACCPDNSIDYAVMEKTERACVVPLAAGWSDVGSWSALWDVRNKDANGNSLSGDVLVHDSHDCLAHSQSKLVTLVGLQDVVVVETKDAVMVAQKDRVQDVKQLVNAMTREGRSEALNHCQVYRPWGSYDSIDNGNRFQVKRIVVKPGAQLSLQKHHHRAEHWIVVSGTARVTCDDKTFLLWENQSTYIPIAAVHRLANPGKIPLEIIEVQSGGYLGEDDIERFEDVYGRSDNVLS